jgi:hypothetical protein
MSASKATKSRSFWSVSHLFPVPCFIFSLSILYSYSSPSASTSQIRGGGGWQVFGFIKKTKMYLLYIFPLSPTHLWLRCSNFFKPSKKHSYGCAANRPSQRLISTPTYSYDLSHSCSYSVCCASRPYNFTTNGDVFRSVRPLCLTVLRALLVSTGEHIHGHPVARNWTSIEGWIGPFSYDINNHVLAFQWKAGGRI